MKIKLPLIAAFVALLSLTACGGGSSSSSYSVDNGTQPTVLTKTDTVVGTGAEAVNGKTLTVKYTGWLYNATATANHGNQFDSGSFSFVLGSNTVIAGFNQGLLGMKQGGKRTLVIPASLAYDTTAKPGIPANSALVFDVELVTVQ